jgi:xylulokinase
MDVVLACDLGGTSFRACLVTDAGEIRAQAVVTSPAATGRDGCAEIAPEAWWSSLVDACGQLALQEPGLFDSVSAIAACGMTRSQVLLGSAGEAVRAAMIWNDTRASGLAARLASELAGQHPEAQSLNAFHPLARLAWVKEHEPEVFQRIRHVLDPKDYLNFRLTGHAASDSISLARLLAAGRPAEGFDLLGACGIPDGILPEIIAPQDKVGTVQPNLPGPLGRLGGVPVFCCSNDTWAAVTGLGALRSGCAYNISGTTEVFGVMSDEPAAAEGLLTVDWGGLSQLGGPSLNGADTMSWLLGLLGRTQGDMTGVIETLLSEPRQPQPLLFLPYLQGERVPFWDPSLRGAFIGLGRQHGAADLVWAVMEGIAFLNREVLERAEAAYGWQASCIRFGGGGAVNPAWCQIKADICGRTVETCAATEPGVLGAAAVAWTGLGRFASLAEAQEQLVRVKSRFEPDLAWAEGYGRLFKQFQLGSDALAPVSRTLAGLADVPRTPAKTSVGN